MSPSLTLKPIAAAGNTSAGTTAPASSVIRVVTSAELVRREIRKLSNDELHQVRLEIETMLRERLGHV